MDFLADPKFLENSLSVIVIVILARLIFWFSSYLTKRTNGETNTNKQYLDLLKTAFVDMQQTINNNTNAVKALTDFMETQQKSNTERFINLDGKIDIVDKKVTVMSEKVSVIEATCKTEKPQAVPSFEGQNLL